MAKKTENRTNPELEAVHNKLDCILAILLRQLNDEGLAKWDNQDKPNMVKMLIDLGFDNKAISRVVGMTYGAVANARSSYKKGKAK
ncbi:MAG: hypothetical protein PHX83_03840 [Acidobacteriia bacterium]|nr:hypothetical protein [Terriglobia bacterium]